VADPGQGSWSVGSSQGSRRTIAIRPISDPACRLRSGSISARFRGVSGAGHHRHRPEGWKDRRRDADALTKAVFDLKTKIKRFRHDAVRKLQDIPPDEKRPRGGRGRPWKTSSRRKKDPGAPRADALRLLAKWGTKEQRAHAAQRPERQGPASCRQGRWRSLAGLGEPSAVEPITRSGWRATGRTPATRCGKFGPQAEPALLSAWPARPRGRASWPATSSRTTGTKACVPAMTQALADRATRTNALHALERLKAVEAAGAIAWCLNEAGGRGEASKILKGFCPAAEKAVVAQLGSKDQGARWEAC